MNQLVAYASHAREDAWRPHAPRTTHRTKAKLGPSCFHRSHEVAGASARAATKPMRDETFALASRITHECLG